MERNIWKTWNSYKSSLHGLISTNCISQHHRAELDEPYTILLELEASVGVTARVSHM